MDFEDFVQRRGGPLLRLCWALTGNRSDADDLAQMTLERVWRRWDRITAGGADPWPYTQRVAVSRLATTRRRRWHREIPAADPTLQAPDSWAVIETVDDEVRTWLAALPTRQRAVVVLRFLLDQSVDQTSHTLGCSVGTVKSQTAKALSTLRGAAAAAAAVDPTEESHR